MTAHAFIVARWPGDQKRTVFPSTLLPLARERCSALDIVWAFSKAHARRLWLEGTEAVRGVDGRLERCGVEP